MGREGKLLLFNGPGLAFEARRLPVRSIQRGEVLVRNLYTTLCGSDLHTYCGLRNEPCPTVLGHELVGEIVEVHPLHPGIDLYGNNLQTGDLVTWSIFSSNPQSVNARLGIPQKGDNLFKYGHALVEGNDAFHGGLAEYCILHKNTAIIRLPRSLPLPIAATLNCSVATVAGALRLSGDVKNKNVLITGMGHLGITCAAMCREAGANWIGAMDIDRNRLENALKFGADEIMHINVNNGKLLKGILKKFPQKGVDIVFDMSGSTDAMEFGLDALAVGGTAIWVGAVFRTRKLLVDPETIIRRLITIRGLHNYNLTDFKCAFEFIQKSWQRFPFREVVEKEFNLEQAEEAFEFAVKHRPLRVGIKIPAL